MDWLDGKPFIIYILLFSRCHAEGKGSQQIITRDSHFAASSINFASVTSRLERP